MRKGKLRLRFGLPCRWRAWRPTPSAAGIDDPRRADYFKEFDGKTIAFVPVTMGIDLTEGWAAVMKQQADRLRHEVRNPRSAFQRRRRRAGDHLADRREAGRARRP